MYDRQQIEFLGQQEQGYRRILFLWINIYLLSKYDQYVIFVYWNHS